MIITASNIKDSMLLTDITKKSKAYWGYTDELMDSWAELLTVTESYIEASAVFKLLMEDTIIGYYSYSMEGDHMARLDNLFVLPDFIGQGFGKVLMVDFLARLQNTSVTHVILESDPHAGNFYALFGFVKTGELETSVKERRLPIMELLLKA